MAIVIAYKLMILWRSPGRIPGISNIKSKLLKIKIHNYNKM